VCVCVVAQERVAHSGGDKVISSLFARLSFFLKFLCVDKYVTCVTLTEITVIEMAAITSSTFALQAAPADRAAAREEARRQMERMSEAMIEEKGLLNHAQAALLLDVSTKRVGELVRLGKLTDFTFLGRKYVSMREVWDRNKQELKAGRPPRPMGQRVAAQLKAAVKTDSAQASLGGYAGSYFKKKREEANERRRADFKRKWQEILEVRRNERRD
jgi:hypothetical protein